jgi:hypothetical protein
MLLKTVQCQFRFIIHINFHRLNINKIIKPVPHLELKTVLIKTDQNELESSSNSEIYTKLFSITKRVVTFFESTLKFWKKIVNKNNRVRLQFD